MPSRTSWGEAEVLDWPQCGYENVAMPRISKSSRPRVRQPAGEGVLHTARLFKHGGSQAVRLPKEFRFDAGEVFVRKEGGEVILSRKEESVADVLREVMGSSPGFMKTRKQFPSQARKWWWE